MPHPHGMPTYDELENMSEAELKQRIDQQYSLPNRSYNIQTLAETFRDELHKRGQKKIEERMLSYTKQVTILTYIILFATLVSLALAFLAYLTSRTK